MDGNLAMANSQQFNSEEEFNDAHYQHYRYEQLKQIIQSLESHRFCVSNEKALQQEIGELLLKTKISYMRELYLDSRNIIDFHATEFNIGIEVKINGNAKSIYKQLERYCEFQQIEMIILVTNRAIGVPKHINSKPAFIVNLGKAWL